VAGGVLRRIRRHDGSVHQDSCCIRPMIQLGVCLP
jgi:hypothetical protein